MCMAKKLEEKITNSKTIVYIDDYYHYYFDYGSKYALRGIRHIRLGRTQRLRSSTIVLCDSNDVAEKKQNKETKNSAWGRYMS